MFILNKKKKEEFKLSIHILEVHCVFVGEYLIYLIVEKFI